MKLGWLPAAKLLAWSTLSRADPVAGCGHCQLSREIRQCPRGGQLPPIPAKPCSAGLSLDNPAPTDSSPNKVHRAKGRRLCLAFALVD